LHRVNFNVIGLWYKENLFLQSKIYFIVQVLFSTILVCPALLKNKKNKKKFVLKFKGKMFKGKVEEPFCTKCNKKLHLGVNLQSLTDAVKCFNCDKTEEKLSWKCHDCNITMCRKCPYKEVTKREFFGLDTSTGRGVCQHCELPALFYKAKNPKKKCKMCHILLKEGSTRCYWCDTLYCLECFLKIKTRTVDQL
jgi:hypothetical protein